MERYRINSKYLLEFEIEDTETIAVTLVTDVDPSLIDTNYIAVAWTSYSRSEKEELAAFAVRATSAAIAWAPAEIETHIQKLQLEDLVSAALDGK